MAVSQILPRCLPVSSFFLAFRGLSISACVCVNRKSGVPKVTPFRTLPLTYDEAQPPSKIYVTKGWLSWNTTNLYGETRHAETTFEDLIIRKFIFGTWHGVLASEVVIKRRHNLIVLAFLASMEKTLQRQVYFLQGYTEELLSNWLKCPVKVELSAVSSKDEVIFKKI
ncbi:28S ribosomal protein S24, mitochondrial [Bulinus truncatus]|nr:28S ribosomal protein S24, mitochondrial [Bulinus truncatus]